ncbi:pyrroline-5-carboxylate reductase family protein [Caldinitratiruptor microaerophilus]|uniref:Pyrroline-5-carboxylate reductase catalytic N-terminal domain-containing protein n=1 Tax=Caldinitratiruptor microaerophilus TaxID=671077 RepID=A0AA35G8X8_9FIRM|nr:hypothetical protein caldi_19780 [Caldinitratiruptor microaerophilus]
MKVAIVGAGRMGSLLAARLPGSFRKVIIARRRARAVQLADEVGGVASDQLSAVRGCHVVLLAIPGPEIPNVLSDLAPHLDRDAIVVNMATDVPTEELAESFPDLRIVAAKVIGHAREMAHGSPGIVVLDRVNPEEEELLASILGGLGPVIRDSEEKVRLANTAVAEEMVKAELSLRRRLEELGLEPELIRVAIKTTAPGVMRSLSDGDAGPFVQDVIRRLRGA